MNPQSVIAIIPARGGSKGILGKNIFPLLGKPLISHTIEQALGSSKITSTIVSTDDQAIAEISRNAGASVILRPADISGDTATSESALIHAVQTLQQEQGQLPDLIVFLQCTSPLRKPDDIDRAIETLISTGADSVLSVSPSHRFLWGEKDGVAHSINYDFRARPRRQDMQPQYAENGSIYVFRPQNLLDSGNRLSGKIALYKMDEDGAIDIDSLLDMKLAEMLLRERKAQQ
jgi:N-acylneuraminate cytidylyltransferase